MRCTCAHVVVDVTFQPAMRAAVARVSTPHWEMRLLVALIAITFKLYAGRLVSMHWEQTRELNKDVYLSASADKLYKLWENTMRFYGNIIVRSRVVDTPPTSTYRKLVKCAAQ